MIKPRLPNFWALVHMTTFAFLLMVSGSVQAQSFVNPAEIVISIDIPQQLDPAEVVTVTVTVTNESDLVISGPLTITHKADAMWCLPIGDTLGFQDVLCAKEVEPYVYELPCVRHAGMQAAGMPPECMLDLRIAQSENSIVRVTSLVTFDSEMWMHLTLNPGESRSFQLIYYTTDWENNWEYRVEFGGITTVAPFRVGTPPRPTAEDVINQPESPTRMKFLYLPFVTG